MEQDLEKFGNNNQIKIEDFNNNYLHTKLSKLFKNSKKFRTFSNFMNDNLIHLNIICFIFSFYYFTILTLFLLFIFVKPQKLKLYTKRTFIYFLLCAVMLFFAFEIETSVNYLVSYFDKNKFNYKSEEDNMFVLLEYIFPEWNSVFNYLQDVFFTLPTVNNFACILVFIFIISLFKRLNTGNVNIFSWFALFFKVMSISRIIRVVAFSSTVIPNPRQNCYSEKFKIPESNWEFFFDMIRFRSAGCNDLIISGHTLFIWISLKLITTLIKGWSSLILKVVVFLTFINIIMTRNHYSVDVILGIIIGELLWRNFLSNANEGNLKEEMQKEERGIEISSLHEIKN
jgi:hypothetical protein